MTLEIIKEYLILNNYPINFTKKYVRKKIIEINNKETKSTTKIRI